VIKEEAKKDVGKANTSVYYKRKFLTRNRQREEGTLMYTHKTHKHTHTRGREHQNVCIRKHTEGTVSKCFQ
jgi:hypothetical protein